LGPIVHSARRLSGMVSNCGGSMFVYADNSVNKPRAQFTADRS
jgi:hypothetical protein